jgi:hypothetical protein
LEDRIRHTGARLAVIDCLQAVRGVRTRDFVGQEFGEISLISETVARHNYTALLIHRMASGRRSAGTNPFVGAAGTFALNGSADGLAALSMFSTTRTERLVHVSGRDVDGTKFIYARDREGRLFFVAHGELAEVWDYALRVYRTLGNDPLTGKAVGEALDVLIGRVAASWRNCGPREPLQTFQTASSLGLIHSGNAPTGWYGRIQSRRDDQ